MSIKAMIESFRKTYLPHWGGFYQRDGEICLCTNCAYVLDIDEAKIKDEMVMIHLPKKCPSCGRKMYNGGTDYLLNRSKGYGKLVKHIHASEARS